MKLMRPSYGDTRKRFAWLPATLHDIHGGGYSISGWVWLESYTQIYIGHYWGWKNFQGDSL